VTPPKWFFRIKDALFAQALRRAPWAIGVYGRLKLGLRRLATPRRPRRTDFAALRLDGFEEDYRRTKLALAAARAGVRPAAEDASPKPVTRPAGGRDAAGESAAPVVSIVIPTRGVGDLVERCLASISRHSDDIPHEVVVVDDSPGRCVIARLPSRPGLVILGNGRQPGFTTACNAGAASARGTRLLFLNDDVEVSAGWLGALSAALDETDGAGAAGPKVVYPNGALQEAGSIVMRDGTTRLVGHGDRPDRPGYASRREVDYCSAVCLLVDRGVFDEVGGFDEAYAPAYYEDVDLCFRIRRAGRRVVYEPGAVVVHHLSATSASIGQEHKRMLSARNRQRLLETWSEEIERLNEVRLIAFYLPQFHPIPENDLWWGKGFTEWRNVTRARPSFEGHYQPHLPADLGFYDLRLPEVMENQAALARRYGIHAFCFYYYWFKGRRMLELALERMLETGSPDFPFCLCWANENWTKTWDGGDRSILIGQDHCDEDDREVILDMIRYLRHPNYLKVDGRPVLLVYRVPLFPDIARTAALWRKTCREEGVGEIRLVMVESFKQGAGERIEPADIGFDAAVEFPPHGMSTGRTPWVRGLDRDFRGHIGDYQHDLVRFASRQQPPYVRYRTVMPGWDNTPRRQNDPFVYLDPSPGAYRAWLEEAIDQTRRHRFGEDRLVFINAWNEWAEGNHLEPDLRYGHAYLQATRDALDAWMLREDG
jgi:GT2 family glycosyltransferase